MASRAPSFWVDPLSTRTGRWTLIIVVLVSLAALAWYLGNLEPQPLRILDAEHSWATDGNYVYHRDTPIFGADPRTFVALDWGYAKDKHAVYYQGTVLRTMDPATFVTLSYYFARDASHVYYNNQKIAGADPLSFEIFPDSYYGKDKTRVYHQTYSVAEADVATFRTADYYQDGYDAEDATHYFENGKPITEEQVATNLANLE